MGIGSWFGRGGSEAARRDFGLLVLSVVRAQPGVAGAEFDDREFVIHYGTPEGMSFRMGLTTPYRRCRGETGPAAHAMLESYVRGIVEGTAAAMRRDSWEVAAPRLRPVLRQAGELASRIQGLRLAENTLWRPVAPGMMERVVVDTPTSMAAVTPHDLVTWGVDAETVFATARANLQGLGAAVVDAFGRSGEPIMFLPDEDGELYAGALPLVPGWLGALRERYGCEFIACVPGNTGVAIGAVTSPQVVAELVELVREVYEEAVRPVSPVPYITDRHGRLIPFRVPPDHPAWPGIRSAESTLAASVYNDQYEGLRADLEAEITDLLPGQLMHARGRDGVEFTVTTWVDTVPTLLPRADRVLLTSMESGSAVEVAWPDLARELALRPVPGLFPERYRVEFLPDAATTARLAAAFSPSPDLSGLRG
ncbi:hypothetical protein [Nocardia higoensis]|uniref:hypothetical protein n=1 Tax=Nocardia higoensis TaxID=228599 RepID=UPI0002D94813|nr:hypothetical protein [Nocardia higoensis]